MISFRRLFLLASLLFTAAGGVSFAQGGFVRSNGQPIPGATITITQGDQTQSTVTDTDGHYGFAPLAAGLWSVTVDIFGFDKLSRQIDFSAAKTTVNFDLQLATPPALQRLRQFAAGSRNRGGNAQQQFDAQLQSDLPGQQTTASAPNPSSSNESFLVSGSLSPGIAQGAQADSGPELRLGAGDFGAGAAAGGNGAVNAPGFAGGGAPGGFGRGGGFGGPGGFGGRGPGNRRPGQAAGAQFGNRARRNQQIHGQASFTLENSALNAKPFSLNGLDIPQAAYAQTRFSFVAGGPLVLPKLVKDPRTQFFLTYFGTRARTPQLFVETVPTSAMRQGDFSQVTQSLGTSASGVPVSIFDPLTHQPFPNNIVPRNLLNPIALSLAKHFPFPNDPGTANNYQFETAQASNANNIGLRVQRNLTNLDRLSVNFQYQDRSGTTAQPFGYSDQTEGYGLNVQLQWTRNLTPTAISNAQIRFNRNYTHLVPFFSLGPDVASELGIPGASANPLDFGPPTLNFTNFASLSDGVATLNRTQSQGASESISLLRGTHSVTLGGGYTRADQSVRTDPNGRGTFNFTGVASSQLNSKGQPVTGTGYDFADFLLGFPQSSSVQYSENNDYFLQDQWNGYAQDEWKARPNLTLLLGVRYEYFSPVNEKYERLANLDIGPGYSAAAAVTPNGIGPYSGGFPGGLINPDFNNWSPRLGLAWKLPWGKRSTIMRSGYGIYYNGQSYLQLGTLLANQPPFAIASNVNTSVENVLTLQKGFLTQSSERQVTNTFAVDRHYRTPYAATWNVSIQREFGGGFFAEAEYQGTKGTRLDVRTLPNEGIPGSSQVLTQRNQFGNASGFTFDQSDGNSIFHALQLRLVRRFNRGISLNAFYQYAKSIDDSSTFGGAGNTVAQNWLDISAERGLSSFDIRHQFSGNFVWTSPVAGPGSHIAADSRTGRLLRDWQLSGGITAQTGNPLTARVLGNTQQLAQTGGVGRGRANATGQPLDSGSGFFNLLAFTVPAGGTYGNAARNTIPGPGLFNLNLAFGRSFNLTERRRVEFRIESNNILNHVNYTNLYTVVNAVNYGLPSAAAGMRTLDAVVRFRF